MLPFPDFVRYLSALRKQAKTADNWELQQYWAICGCFRKLHLRGLLCGISIVVSIPAPQLIQLHCLVCSVASKKQVVARVDLPCKALRSTLLSENKCIVTTLQ